METKTELTDAELEALTDLVLSRMLPDFKEECNCPLHRSSKEERAEMFAAAIDATVKESNDPTNT